MVVAMVGHRPDLVDVSDLRKRRAEAIKNESNEQLVAALTSIIEKQELANMVSESEARKAGPARL